MTPQEQELPPLPPRIRVAMSDARDLRPSPALEQRVWRAIEAAARARDDPRRERARRFSIPFGLVIAGAAAAALFAGVCALGVPARLAGAAASVALAVHIPDGGHVWVDLPMDTHRHDADSVSIAFEAPASVALRLDEGKANQSLRSECEADRCVHRWETRPEDEDGSTPRVHITEPGYYEFSAIHISPDQSCRLRYTVMAME